MDSKSKIKNQKSKILKILPTVSKPTRYLGNEVNAVKKELNNPEQVRFALAFPDIYDVGMSHLGLKILYQILNSRDDVWSERVYAPWIDMEKKMRAKGIPLFTMESASPLRDFDIIGFSLQYEMSYTNVLNMLELAQIPLLATDRVGVDARAYPLIIAGGPCVFNPEPMADFIDLFVIGDGEEVITEIVDCYKAHRDRDKKELLGKMAGIEGVYVPSLASVEEQPDGILVVTKYPMDAERSINPESSMQTPVLRVRKRIVKDLDSAPYPVDYLVPYMRPIHDRAIIEIMRGCSRGCRFCQAGMIYRPVREKASAVVERLADELIKNTGYEELSLSSLSTCDHSSIYEIVHRLSESLGMEKHVSISLPSLRIDAFSIGMAQKLGSTGRTGLTFAPEVATQRMQNVINKYIPRSEVLSTVEDAFSTGWNSLKLYFMIGLPTETEEDVVEIAHLVKEILDVALRINRRASLNVSVSTFVPKAHTPFQWERQSSMDEIQQKQKLLMDKMRSFLPRSRRSDRRVNVSFHSPQVSYLEGVFARGDRRLGQVLLAAHTLGCKLDGWSESFDFDAWMQAFTQCRIDPDVYQNARRHDQVMPWDHIDACLRKDFLLAERDRAYGSELTPDCRQGVCTECGVRDMLDAGCWMLDASGTRREGDAARLRVPASPLKAKPSVPASQKHPVTKIRFQFAKREEVKFISHLNLLNTFTRAFRRAGIPIAYSHGFNPHPKISFGSVLPVGTTSECEFADIDFEAYIEPDDFIARTNDQLPPGLEILEAWAVPLKTQSLMAQISMASYIVRVPVGEGFIPSRIHSILNMDHIWIERSRKAQHSLQSTAKRARHKSKTSSFVDIKPFIRSIRLLEHIGETLELEMMLGEGKEGKARPEEVVRLIVDGFTQLSLHDQESILSATEIRRIGIFIEHQGQLFSPMEIMDQ